MRKTMRNYSNMNLVIIFKVKNTVCYGYLHTALRVLLVQLLMTPISIIFFIQNKMLMPDP